MLTLIKGADVYAPEHLGKKDVLIGAGRILMMEESIQPVKKWNMNVVDAAGKMLVPGFIDNHVHLLGGGGEGGFKTRTPEALLTDLTTAGITTVVGCLGTDGFSRNMTSLVAKAYGLREEGISAYVYTGSYQVPVQTLTDTIEEDLMMIDPVIGVGEVALSDHRSSQPRVDELTKAAAAARVGGILSGKSGIVNVHLGDGSRGLSYLEEIAATTEIPITQFLPTHLNRNSDLFAEGLRYAQKGGYMDLTTSTTDVFLKEGELKCSRALKKALQKGVLLEQITFSSDGQGSLPAFDEQGRLRGLQVGKSSSLFQEVRDAVLEDGLPLDQALSVITINPARILKLKRKGHLEAGNDADLVLLDPDTLAIDSVMAMGRWMIYEKEVLIKGTFQ